MPCGTPDKTGLGGGRSTLNKNLLCAVEKKRFYPAERGVLNACIVEFVEETFMVNLVECFGKVKKYSVYLLMSVEACCKVMNCCDEL